MDIPHRPDLKLWLPTTKKELELRGWQQPDIIIFSGDAYIDHPSFGAAVIGRIFEKHGLKTAIVPQPNWQDDLRDFTKLGAPKLFFAVTAGNMDSMVNHYTANKRLRSNDAYTPGGQPAKRPDYATAVYTRILKSKFPGVPVIIGGIEASLRRFCHYDYWQDKLMPSILVSSGADLLAYGLGEKVAGDIAGNFAQGKTFSHLRELPQVAWLSDGCADLKHVAMLHSYEKCLASKSCYADNFRRIEIESNKMQAGVIAEPCGNQIVVVNPPYAKLSTEELDATYKLPFTYLPHPKYQKRGLIPAYEMIKFSSNIHRGCFGGCSFCTISAHQGKFISSRSQQSIIDELHKITGLPGFKGHISDLGGPSANMYSMEGIDLSICRQCARASCIFPAVCKNLDTDHSKLTLLYRKARQLKGINKVTIGSGIRYDMFAGNRPSDKEYIAELITHHVSGRLKVAPEHTESKVLKMMRKPSFELFEKFSDMFYRICREQGLNQQLIPYFISSHPECSAADMQKLQATMKNLGIKPEQVQDFTPTPMTLATVIFYTGIDPYTGREVFTAKNPEEKLAQKQHFLWHTEAKKVQPKIGAAKKKK
jgi:uncharacterized radical SAM protein YgiQ